MGKDYALESEGAEITFSTSSHPKYQPEFMIDGDEKSFFMTTGCFPQTFTIKLKNVVNISNITMVSSGSLLSNCYFQLFLILFSKYF